MDQGEEHVEFGTQSELVKRDGWSKRMIEKLIGDPHDTRQNPYYWREPAVRLFRVDIVLALEGRDDLAHEFEATRRRSKRGKATAAKREDATIGAAERYDPEIRSVSITM